MGQLKLLCWNVNGIRAVYKKGFLEWLEAANPDILGLQETKISADQVTFEFQQPTPNYQTHWSFSEKRGYSGTCILSKETPRLVSHGMGIERFDREGRIVEADYGDFVFFTVYFPNGKRDDERLQYKMDFYEEFLKYTDALKAQGRKIIVCGDYNTAHKPIDLARPKPNEKISGFLPIERAWMDKLVDHGYVDTFRMFHAEEAERYSWWDMQSRARDRNVGWRIDYFFVSDNLVDQVVDADILDQVFGSDHCPVMLTLKV